MAWEDDDQLDDKSWNGGSSEIRMARKAENLYENGKHEEALEILNLAIEKSAFCPNLRFDKALVLNSIYNFEEAIDCLRGFLEYCPDDSEAMVCLAIDLIRVGHHDEALEILEEVQRKNPELEAAYCAMIVCYGKMELPDLAATAFYSAQNIDPDCYLCFYNMGTIQFSQLKQYSRAISCWTKAKKSAPKDVKMCYQIAKAYWLNGDTEMAKAFLFDAVKENPSKEEAILDLGLILAYSGQIESAKEKFSRVVEGNCQSPLAMFLLGEALLFLGRGKEALSYYKKAMDLDYNFAFLRYRMYQLGAMNTEDLRKDFDLIISDLSIIDPDVLVSMASIFLSQENIGLAYDCLLSVVSQESSLSLGFSIYREFIFGILFGSRGELIVSKSHLQNFLNKAEDSFCQEVSAAKRIIKEIDRANKAEARANYLRLKLRLKHFKVICSLVDYFPKRRRKKIIRISKNESQHCAFVKKIINPLGGNKGLKFTPSILVRTPDWRSF